MKLKQIIFSALLKVLSLGVASAESNFQPPPIAAEPFKPTDGLIIMLPPQKQAKIFLL